MKKNFTNHETYHLVGIYAPKNHILQFLKNPPLEKSLPPNWPKIPQNGINPPFWPHWILGNSGQPTKVPNR